MAKRLADTDKYKKKFIRSLPAAYKLLWDYICLDCNHAGIWEVDFEVAQLRLGNDITINEQEALKLFNNEEEKVVVLNHGSKWFIKPFIEFQYGNLDPNNRVHSSVLALLKKEGIKGLARVLNDPKNKSKDKDKDSIKDKYGDFVLLTGLEFKNLVDKFGESKVKSLIETMNNGIAAKGYKYKSHYHALLNWEKREPIIKNNKQTTQSQVSRNPKPKKDCDVCKGTGKIPDGSNKGAQCFCVV
jgi:hypothetical protein